MNLFVFSSDHDENARWHCDRHVVKMILEATQLVCTAVNINGGNSPYKSTHINHPVCKWVRFRQENYFWTCEYGLALCKEYEYRFNKVHKCKDILIKYIGPNNAPFIDLLIGMTPFVQAMPDQYKDKCPYTAYRKYFIGEKQHIAKWTKREIPPWFKKLET